MFILGWPSKAVFVIKSWIFRFKVFSTLKQQHKRHHIRSKHCSLCKSIIWYIFGDPYFPHGCNGSAVKDEFSGQALPLRLQSHHKVTKLTGKRHRTAPLHSTPPSIKWSTGWLRASLPQPRHLPQVTSRHKDNKQERKRHKYSKDKEKYRNVSSQALKHAILSQAPLYDARAGCDLQWHRSWREPEQLILSVDERHKIKILSGTITTLPCPSDEGGPELCGSPAAKKHKLKKTSEVWTAYDALKPKTAGELLGRRSAQQKRGLDSLVKVVVELWRRILASEED